MKTSTDLEGAQRVALVFAQQLACAATEWARDQERTGQAHSPHYRAICPALRSFGEAMIDVKILEGRRDDGNHSPGAGV